MVTIRCKNNGEIREFAPGTTLHEMYNAFTLGFPYGQ